MSPNKFVRRVSLGVSFFVESIFSIACMAPIVGVFSQMLYRRYHAYSMCEPIFKPDGDLPEGYVRMINPLRTILEGTTYSGYLLERFLNKQPVNKLRLAFGIVFPFVFMYPDVYIVTPAKLVASPFVLVFFDIPKGIYKGSRFVVEKIKNQQPGVNAPQQPIEKKASNQDNSQKVQKDPQKETGNQSDVVQDGKNTLLFTEKPSTQNTADKDPASSATPSSSKTTNVFRPTGG